MSPGDMYSEYHVVRDGAVWLVDETCPDSDGAVLGRWTSRDDAEADCARWCELSWQQWFSGAGPA